MECARVVIGCGQSACCGRAFGWKLELVRAPQRQPPEEPKLSVSGCGNLPPSSVHAAGVILVRLLGNPSAWTRQVVALFFSSDEAKGLAPYEGYYSFKPSSTYTSTRVTICGRR